jgi:hypothetical protein
MTDCSEIRNLLSEYLDDALDAKAKAVADEHLRTCPACREELDSLKALVKGLGSIEPVKAPADFLDQFHKRMAQPSALSKMRNWLFFPLRVKIPLQLAGAAVTALIILFILPMQQSSLKLSTKTEQEKKDAAYTTDEAKGMIQPAERPRATVQQAAPAAPAKDMSAGKPTPRSETPVPKAAIPEPSKEKREVAVNLKMQVRAKAVSAEPSAAQAPASPALSEMQRRTLAARAPAQEDKKQESIEKEPESVLSITKAIEAVKGKVLSVDRNPQTGLPEFIQAEMPAGQMPILYEKLRELGELQVSPQTSAEKDSDLVQIRIRLIDLQ